MAKKIKKTVVKIKMINIDRAGCHLGVNGKINNKKAFLIIDTGASQTVLDKNRIGHFLGHEDFEKMDSLSSGLGTNTMESHIVPVTGFQIGDKKIKNEKMILLDLSHVNHSYTQLKMKPIDGVIGGDLLKKHKAVIDYGKKVLILF